MLNRLPPFRRRLTQLLMTLLAASLLFTLLPSTALSRPPDKMALGNSGDPLGGDKGIQDDSSASCRSPFITLDEMDIHGCAVFMIHMVLIPVIGWYEIPLVPRMALNSEIQQFSLIGSQIIWRRCEVGDAQ